MFKDIEIDLDKKVADLKEIIHALTEVPTNRQKIIVGAKTLKVNFNLRNHILKEETLVIMIGEKEGPSNYSNQPVEEEKKEEKPLPFAPTTQLRNSPKNEPKVYPVY
jgi:hypothetical protein